MEIIKDNLNKVMITIFWGALVLCLWKLNEYTTSKIIIVGALIILLLTFNDILLLRYQLYFIVISTFIIDNFWISGVNIPLNIKYIADIINFIIIIKIIIKFKNYSKLWNDGVFILALTFIIFSILKLFFVHYSFYEFLNGIRIYSRGFLFYIVLKFNENESIIDDIKFIVFLQIPSLLIQIIKSFGRDQIGGTFGIYGQTYLFILMIPVFYYILDKYLKKSLSSIKMFIFVAIFFGICVINETKVAFIIIPIVTILFIVGFNAKYSLMRKIMLVGLLFIGLIIGYRVMTVKYPGTLVALSSRENLVNYATNENNRMYYFGRLQNFNYIKNVELSNISNNLIGIGIGRALPDEFSSAEHFARGRTISRIITSEKYMQLQQTGYFLSSLNIFYYENGILGVLIYLCIFIILLKRSVANIKGENCGEISNLSYALCGLLIAWLPLFYYNDIFYQYQTSVIFWALAGIVSRYYALNNE
jgi:hypothetical protein